MTSELNESRVVLDKDVLGLNKDAFEKLLEQALALSNDENENGSYEISKKEMMMNAELIQIVVHIGLIGMIGYAHDSMCSFLDHYENISVKENELIKVRALQSLQLIRRTIQRVPDALHVTVKEGTFTLIKWLIWRMMLLLKYVKMELVCRDIYETYIVISCMSCVFAEEALDAVKMLVNVLILDIKMGWKQTHDSEIMRSFSDVPGFDKFSIFDKLDIVARVFEMMVYCIQDQRVIGMIPASWSSVWIGYHVDFLWEFLDCFLSKSLSTKHLVWIQISFLKMLGTLLFNAFQSTLVDDWHVCFRITVTLVLSGFENLHSNEINDGLNIALQEALGIGFVGISKISKRFPEYLSMIMTRLIPVLESFQKSPIRFMATTSDFKVGMFSFKHVINY